jgi:predicted double-glycine peptidase
MNPWVAAGAVFGLGLAGAGAGWAFSRVRSRWWVAGFVVPLVLVLMIGATRHDRQLDFVAPFSWLVAGRLEFVLLAPIATMLLFTPLGRMKQARQRVLVGAFALVFMVHSAVMPFLGPALVREQLAGLKTWQDRDGICLQQTGYTCGPAAAVTALRRLGLPAEEGELAILMHTCPSAGTPPDTLARALRQRYGEAIHCEYRYFRSIDALSADTPTLAIMKFGLFVDHYVVVLEIAGESVTVGDPLDGVQVLSRQAFAEKWRGAGVVLRRK